MLTSKSPRKVLTAALAAGLAAFDDYSHVSSPHKFTRPQLLACLVLKAFYGLDYRGVCELLADSPDLCQAIESRSVPHWTTLHKASRRLLRNESVRLLIEDTVRRILPRKRLVSHAAADSSGFDGRQSQAPAGTTTASSRSSRRTTAGRTKTPPRSRPTAGVGG